MIEMLKRRSVEIAVGIAVAVLVPLMGFLTSDDTPPPIAGYAVYEGEVQGTEFTAFVQGQLYQYRFMGSKWFQSRQDSGWEYRPDMGKTLVSGLLYLQSYGAEIFFQGESVNDILAISEKAQEGKE